MNNNQTNVIEFGITIKQQPSGLQAAYFFALELKRFCILHALRVVFPPDEVRFLCCFLSRVQYNRFYRSVGVLLVRRRYL